MEEFDDLTQSTSQEDRANATLYIKGPVNLNDTTLKFPLQNAKGKHEATLQLR
jgi:hypothetical protein